MDRPEFSLPKQMQEWSELKGAYRFLNNPRVQVASLGQQHREQTRLACAGHSVVLCVQDDSDLSGARIEGDTHLMHNTLAVLPSGQLLGILQQRFFQHAEVCKGETRKQRAERWRESDVWKEAVEEIGESPEGCRLVHVADRGADNLRFMHACVRQDVGFVVRAHHDRRVDQGEEKLWPHLNKQPIQGRLTVQIGAQRKGKVTRRAREATLAIRFATVELNQPSNCHEAHDGPLKVSVVYLREIDPPTDVEPIDWMLLSSEPINNLEQVKTIVQYYRVRWVIEEWHRATKEGCRLERSQLADPQALLRLTAVLSIIAVHLIQLRDSTTAHPDELQPLQQRLAPIWIEVVAALGDVQPEQLTPKQFWHTLAQRGGWLGRKHDPRPGWQALWTGWRISAA